jgi:hypothetical protein
MAENTQKTNTGTMVQDRDANAGQDKRQDLKQDDKQGQKQDQKQTKRKTTKSRRTRGRSGAISYLA